MSGGNISVLTAAPSFPAADLTPSTTAPKPPRSINVRPSLPSPADHLPSHLGGSLLLPNGLRLSPTPLILGWSVVASTREASTPRLAKGNMATEVGASPVISAQRKRAFEAIERTYAVAKPVISQQQGENRKRTRREERKGRKGDETAPVATPEPDLAARKVGHVTFRGHAAGRGTAGISDEAVHAAYYKLSQTIHENLVKPHVQTNAINHVLHDLLQNGDSAHKYMQGSRSMKIDDWLLLDNYVPGRSALQNARLKALQRHSKRSRKHMSMRQHRACGSFQFPSKCSKFELFKPMHEMWKEYIVKLIKQSGKQQLGHVLLTADLQGAILQVVECKANAFTGMSGIMVRETVETFGIITQNDQFRVVPKKGSAFQLQAGSWKITLFGDKLSLRNIGP